MICFVRPRGSVRLRRIGWGVIAQALTSLANLVISFQGAIHLGTRGFGALATVVALLYIIQSGSRALFGQVYISLHSATSIHDAESNAVRAQGGALLTGFTAGAALAITAVFIPAPQVLTEALFAASAATAAMAMFDCRRFVLIGQRRTRAAAFSALILLLVQLGGGVVLRLLGRTEAWSLILLLALSNTTACLAVMPKQMLKWQFASTVSWLREHHRLARTFLVDSFSVTAAGQGIPIVVTGIIGLEATASLRSAILLMAPVFFLIQAFDPQATAEMARVDECRRWRVSVVIQAIAFGAGAIMSAVVLSLPDELLDHLGGDNALAAQAALPGTALFLTASLMSIGPKAILRVKQATFWLTAIRAATFPLMLGAPAAAAALTGSAGAVAFTRGGVNVVIMVVFTVAARALSRTVSRRPSAPPAQETA